MERRLVAGYRNKKFQPIIQELKRNGNYLGSHSDKHLLYNDWNKSDSLLVTRRQFEDDLLNSYKELNEYNISKKGARYFLPPYEWYNDSIAQWTEEQGLKLINFSPGTRSNADYTYPEMGAKYVDSKTVMQSVLDYEKKSTNGLNGFILLFHIGTDPKRTDKFYWHLPELITVLKDKGYDFVSINKLLSSE